MTNNDKINKVMLVILDGYGHSDDKYFNAVAAADSPTLDMIKAD